MVRIAIALAAYKPNPKWLFDQIKSIQHQTHTDWRLFLGFDSPLECSLPEDPRISVRVHGSRLGLKGNFESQIKRALAWGPAAIAFSDQDDVWDANKLETLLAHLPPMGLVHSNARLSGDASGLLWESERRGVDQASTLDLLIRNVVAGTGCMIDASLVKQFPYVPEEAPYHDHWYALLASLHGGIRALHQPLYSYRIHGSNTAGFTPYRGWLHTKASWKEAPSRYYKASFKLAVRLEEALKEVRPELRTRLRPTRLLFHGLKHAFKDPLLARSSLVRALGGLLSLRSS